MKQPSASMIKRVAWPLAPLPGESLMGFVGRVAAHNVIDDTLSITRQAGQRFGHRTSLVYDAGADLDALATALRVGVAELRARAYPALRDGTSSFFGLRVPFYHLETKVRRFSPASLAAAGFHRAAWTYRPIPFCAESWEYLSDTCRLCGSIQRWYHAQGPDRCDACGDDLTGDRMEQVPELARDTLSFVAGLVDPIEECRARALARVPSALARLKPEDVLELILHLRHLTASVPCRRRRDHTWRENPVAQAEMLRASADLLLGWPERPREVLADRIAAQSGKGNNAILRNGPLFLPGHLATLSPAVRDVVKSLAPRVGEFGSTTFAPITVRHAALASGLAREELGRYRRAGWLRTVLFANNSGAPMAGFDETEIAWLGEAIRARRSTSTVAATLGISLHGVEQLVCLGALSPIDHPVFTARYDRPHFEGGAIDDLIARLNAAAQRSLPGIPLRQAVRAIPGAKPWGPIIAAMLDGRLPFSRAADRRLVAPATIAERSLPFLASLRFEKGEFPDFPFDSVMSKKDALDALNLLPSDAAFLKPGTVEAKRPCDYRVVQVAFVEEMARDFVSITELRARSGPSADTVKARLSLAGVGPSTDFGWPRAQAEAALFGGG